MITSIMISFLPGLVAMVAWNIKVLIEEFERFMSEEWQ